MIHNCMKVNAEVHGRTQGGVSCTWRHAAATAAAAAAGVYAMWVFLCKVMNEILIISSIWKILFMEGSTVNKIILPFCQFTGAQNVNLHYCTLPFNRKKWKEPRLLLDTIIAFLSGKLWKTVPRR